MKESAHGPPYRCETCTKKFAEFPDGIDKCTACSGDLIPEQTFREKWPDRKFKLAALISIPELDPTHPDYPTHAGPPLGGVSSASCHEPHDAARSGRADASGDGRSSAGSGGPAYAKSAERPFKLADLLSGGPLGPAPDDEDEEQPPKKKKKKGLSPLLIGGAIGLGGAALGAGAVYGSKRRLQVSPVTGPPAAPPSEAKIPETETDPYSELAPQGAVRTEHSSVVAPSAGVGVLASRAAGLTDGAVMGAQVTPPPYSHGRPSPRNEELTRAGVGGTLQPDLNSAPRVRLTSGMVTDVPTNHYDTTQVPSYGVALDRILRNPNAAHPYFSDYVDDRGVLNQLAMEGARKNHPRAYWNMTKKLDDWGRGRVFHAGAPLADNEDIVGRDASRWGRQAVTPTVKGGVLTSTPELDSSRPNYPRSSWRRLSEAAMAEEQTGIVARSPSALTSLLLAQQHSDHRDYKAKHRILSQLLRQSPQDFTVDQPHPAHPGLTHLPTGFRMHAPFSLAAMATGVPKTAGALRDLLGCQSTGTDYQSLPKEANAMSQQERVRLLLPTPTGHLMELFDNPKYPDNLGKFRFPGGGVEPGETYQQAAVREAKEELGVDLSGKTFRYVGADHRPEYANEHYLAVDDHGVSPGSFADAANPGSKVTLFDGRPEGEKYIGPDLSKLVPRTAAKEAGAKERMLTGMLKPKPPVPKLPAPAPKPTAGPLKPAPATPAAPAPAPKPIPPPVTTPTPLTPPTSIAPATTTATAPVTLAPKPGLLGRAAAVPVNAVKNQLGFGYKGPLQGVNPFKPTASRFVPRPTMAKGRALNPLAWGQYGVHRLTRGLGQTAGGRAFGTLSRSARHALTTSPVRSVADAVLPGSGRFAAPLVTGALSAPVAYAGYRAQRALPDAADEELQQVGVPEDVRNDQWWRTWGTQPKMLYHGLAPTWAGGDDTRIGRLPGHYLKHVVEDTPRDLAGKELNVHEPTAADTLKAPGRYLPTPSTLAKQTILKNVEDNLVDGQPAVLKATAKDVAADLRSDAPKTTPLQALRDPRKAIADEAAWLERTKAELDRSPIVSDLVESVDPRVYNTPGALEAMVKKYTGDSSKLVADAVRHQAEMKGVAPPVKGMKFDRTYYWGETEDGGYATYDPKTKHWRYRPDFYTPSHPVPGPPPGIKRN